MCRWKASHRFDGERFTGLMGMNDHVLGTVVPKYTLDIVHLPDEPHIGNEQTKSDAALDQVCSEVIGSGILNESRNEYRYQEENNDSES